MFVDPLVLLTERGIYQSAMDPQRDIIEPGDFCGSLPLKLIRKADKEQRPIAQGIVEVRSIKVKAQILEDFPELTREDINACFAFAADLLTEKAP